jgi:hypothetical protein
VKSLRRGGRCPGRVGFKLWPALLGFRIEMELMRQVTRICDRCGAVLTDEHGSILELKAGDLVDRAGSD